MYRILVKDIERSMQKSFLKRGFIHGIQKALEIEIIRFMMGGRLKTGSENK